MASLRLLATLTAVLIATAAASCSPEEEADRGTAPPDSIEVTESAGGTTYQSAPLDLCTKTDLAPLNDLNLTVESATPETPLAGSGTTCFWKMKTAGGQLASLRVEAVEYDSIDEAESAYLGQQEVSAMTRDGDIAGLGEQAEGLTLETEPGFKQAEYLVHMRASNLTLKVWLSVGGNAFAPKETLKGKTVTIIQATLATVSTEWKGA